MPDIKGINAHIQDRLKHEGHDEVTAVEAASWLDEAGLLRDSNERPGLPLRELLRDGQIEGQLQRPNQRYGRWFIRRLAK